jgi:hypothetical protein
MLNTDTSQAWLGHKCMFWAGQIDEERYRLDNGISDTTSNQLLVVGPK